MSQFLPTAPYRGTRDFLPEEMSVRQQIFDRLYDVIERYGYRRYDGPTLEPAEIYEAKSGQEIVNQQLYTLTDRGGRRLALRPEMTPSVARIIAGNAGKLQFPVRWYSNPSCYRYERPQRGRVREHWQVNVDVFGSDSAACEIEFFELIHDMMAALGATSDMWMLRVNDRVLLHSLLTDVVGVPEERTRDVASLIDRWEKYPREQLLADGRECGLDEEQFERLEHALKSGEELIDELPAEARERSHLVQVLRSDACDLVNFDPLIVRGFDYYTSTVFEVFDRNPVNSRSLFGGGRYDDLAGLFSSQRIPGFGFGMGDVTLMDFLGTYGLLPEPRNQTDVVVVPLEQRLFDAAREVARRIRLTGYRVTTPLELRKLGKELTRADKAGARVAVIVGPDEWSSGTVGVRELATREQRNVAIDAVAGDVHGILAG